MSDVAEETAAVALPSAWARLEAAVEESVATIELYRRRAEEAEREVTRLREALESTLAEPSAPGDAARRVRRLQAENTALRSRMAQAQRRIEGLLRWTDALEDRR